MSLSVFYLWNSPGIYTQANTGDKICVYIHKIPSVYCCVLYKGVPLDRMEQAIRTIVRDGMRRRWREFHLFTKKVDEAYWEIQDNPYSYT